MKTLLLLRHAKAKDGSPGLPDFDRTLNDRGRNEAQAIGNFLRSQDVPPSLALSSSAKRARETTELVLESAGLTVEVRYDERIYEAGPTQLLEVVAQIEDEHNAVLLVGHNPGMEELLQLLTNRFEQMATCTLAKLDLAGDKWADVLSEKGRVDWIVRPKDLTVD